MTYRPAQNPKLALAVALGMMAIHLWYRDIHSAGGWAFAALWILIAMRAMRDGDRLAAKVERLRKRLRVKVRP